MAQTNQIADIEAQAILMQYEQEQYAQQSVQKIKTPYDVKNYLNARLGPNETTKTLTIRLLPFEPNGGSCFYKVHMHTVKVNKEVSPSGWKTFVCPVHNNDENGKQFGESCPFCNVSKKARELRSTSLDEPTRKKYGDIEYINKVKDMWIVRCIERGHEEDGVKFWLFNTSKKKEGVFDKLVNLYQQRHDSEAKKGREYNIFGLHNGKDLIITLNKTTDGKTTIQIIDDGMPSPLSESEEQMAEWVNDPKKWTDVYTVKPLGYMEVVASGGVPVYSKELGKWVDKNEAKKASDEAKQEEFDEVFTKPKMTYEDLANDTGGEIINGNDVG